MKNLGGAKRYLGMVITRNKTNSKVFISQKDYLKKVPNKFGIINAKIISVPLGAYRFFNELCPQNEAEEIKMERAPYAIVVGSLILL